MNRGVSRYGVGTPPLVEVAAAVRRGFTGLTDLSNTVGWNPTKAGEQTGLGRVRDTCSCMPDPT